MKSFDYVILGGGAAGLCAAMRLIELGASPLVIEGGSYPAHKVCGEFFSPAALKILHRWNVDSIPIQQARIHTSSTTLNFTFSSPAGSLSHLSFDPYLAEQIAKKGGMIRTQTKLIQLHPASTQQEDHRLTLESGEILEAKHLLIATGRIPHFTSPVLRMPYVGFKAHFAHIALNSTLEMFSFPGAYLGLVPIEGGKVNLACLARIEKVKSAPSSQNFMQSLINSHPILKLLIESGDSLFETWMETNVPEFGLRQTPNWPRTYFLGDATGTIPPASGNGLSLAIVSGYLAAEFAIQDDAAGFKKVWSKRCASPIWFGKRLHQLFLHPDIGNLALNLCRLFPFIPPQLFNLTRGKF